MIFVTVGTHEQQFNRLIRQIDKLKCDRVITEDVIVQLGFSTYRPQYCEWYDLLSYSDMEKYFEEASLVITHGGPATYLDALSKGKKTIVVPRLREYKEHVNNHQLDFAEKFSRTNTPLVIVKDIRELGKCITEMLTKEINGFNSNTDNFIRNFKKIVEDLIEI